MYQNINQLSGHALSYAVHIALGHDASEFIPNFSVSYATDPLAAANLIHEYNIGVKPCLDGSGLWVARAYTNEKEFTHEQYGNHLIEASMRTLVSKLIGDELEIPESILNPPENSAMQNGAEAVSGEHGAWARLISVDGFPQRVAACLDEEGSPYVYMTKSSHMPSMGAALKLVKDEFLNSLFAKVSDVQFFEVSDDGHEICVCTMVPVFNDDGEFEEFDVGTEYELEGNDLEMALMQALFDATDAYAIN